MTNIERLIDIDFYVKLPGTVVKSDEKTLIDKSCSKELGISKELGKCWILVKRVYCIRPNWYHH